MLPATTGSNRESKLVGVFRRRFARFFDLLPVRRVLERLVVLCERLFRLALLHEHIAARFQRIGQCGPRWFASLSFTSAPARSPWRASATPTRSTRLADQGRVLPPPISPLSQKEPYHLC